ncbi:MAG: Gfo/Idh/MocA family oxidoreductase [Planctomycetes bacterium]|nr:Gfo/Idh/MocA family oxidoreductase [Planctomycetota bacterium]
MSRSKVTPVRFAVVGLGHFAQTAILPAFANASEKAKLSALVTGDSRKAAKLSQRYDTESCDYEAYDKLLASGDIDAVYIALPNSKHREYTERAAQAGIHVLCEKPLAYTSADAQAMIDACQEADVRLMTAYRLHFEEGNLQAIEAVKKGRIGETRLFDSLHTMQVESDNIRIDKSLGGGPLEDIGIYCINAARYLFRSEPEEVVALASWGNDPRFEEVPEAVSATLRFPGERLAAFLCGFGEAKASQYRVIGTEGILMMDPAYTWNGDIEQTIIKKDKEEKRTFEHRDQVAAEILYFAECVQMGREPEPSGREGLIDVRIIEALRTSYLDHRPVRIERLPEDPRPDGSQSIKRKPPQRPEPVNAEAPSRE